MSRRMSAFHQELHYKTPLRVMHVNCHGINYLAHWHSEIELIYIRSGDADAHTGGNNFHVNAGDLVICDSNDIHYYDGRRSDAVMEFLIFDPTILAARYASHNFIRPYLTADEMHNAGLDAEWDRLIDTVDRELDASAPYFSEIITSLVRHFWFSVMRLVPADSRPHDAQASSETPHGGSRTISPREILSYLEEHYSDPISLSDAAARAGFSECYFSRYFKSLTGTNFNHYLNLLRIAHATDMLYENADRITDIASACGFSNTRTFNRVFRSCTGMSPTDYQNSSQESTYGLQ
jgi:AraC-like DNA-binding protein